VSVFGARRDAGAGGRVCHGESRSRWLLRAERREYLEARAGLILTYRERTALLLRDVEDLPARRSGRALELLQGDGAFTHRQRARETAETFRPPAEAGFGMTHPLQSDLALYSTGDPATVAPVAGAYAFGWV